MQRIPQFGVVFARSAACPPALFSSLASVTRRSYSKGAFTGKQTARSLRWVAFCSTVASFAVLEPFMRAHADKLSGEIGSFFMQGLRPYMEDVVSVQTGFLGPGSVLAAVFDGHAGKRAALFASDVYPQTLKKLISERLPSLPLGSAAEVTEAADLPAGVVAGCMRDSIVRTDSSFCAIASNQQWRDGTTALIALITPSRDLFISNTGDSRAVLCNRRFGAFPVTTDHKPESPAEEARIVASGGSVRFHSGCFRVHGLAMSRAVGDCHLKQFGVIATPDVFERKISADDEFLILATDGLWDTVDSHEAYHEVQISSSNLQVAAERLAKRAFNQGSADNISVVIVDLRFRPTAEVATTQKDEI